MRALILGTLTAGLLWPIASQGADATPSLMSQLDSSFGINANVFSNLGDDAWVTELSVPDRSRQIALAGLIRIKGSGENLVTDLIQSFLQPLVFILKVFHLLVTVFDLFLSHPKLVFQWDFLLFSLSS